MCSSLLATSARATTIFENVPPEYYNEWTTDFTAYELGTEFHSSVDGNIVGLMVYLGSYEAEDVGGTLTARLWDAFGTELVHADFDSPQEGWNEVAIAPYFISAGDTYVVSVNTYAENGSYMDNKGIPGAFEGDVTPDSPDGYFGDANEESNYTNGPLTATAGYFSTVPGSFPTEIWPLDSDGGANYFRDINFQSGVSFLQAGDADQDLDFDQLDLVQVQIAAKYLTGQAATWGEGDWNGAPGGAPGAPPQGNGLFDQIDIISALAPGHYLTGPYAALGPNGQAGDGQSSVGYDAGTGEVWVDPPAGVELTSINIDSEAGIFTGSPADNLGGSFDNDTDNNIFKATFGASFGSLSFGTVAQTGLSEDFVANDLTVVGSLAGGGELGDVDLIYIPEPSTVLLLALGVVSLFAIRRRG